jgi:REP element-mobilizing transposase RayT
MMGDDHIHMCLSTPPKYAVSNVVGIKGEECNTDCVEVWWETEELHG